MTTSKPTKPRAKRGDLPKAVIRPGSFGFLPFNAVSASYLYQGVGDLILGYKDTESTQRLKSRTALELLETGKKAKHELSIKDKFFNGMTDALYRGKLPQVLLIAPHPDDWQTLLIDTVEYLDRLLSLGFFVPKKEIIKRDPIEDYMPVFILAGEGMVYNNFITSVTHHLNQLEKNHPTFEPGMKQRVLDKFVRGFAGDEYQLSLPEGELPNQEGLAYTLLPVARIIRIAGGSPATQELIKSVLSLYSLTVIIEDGSNNAPERLELENAWERINTVVLPNVFKAEEAQQLADRIRDIILTIGRERKAFSDSYTLKATPAPKTGKKNNTVTVPQGRVKTADAILLQGLSVTAERLGMTTEKQLFEALAAKVFECASK